MANYVSIFKGDEIDTALSAVSNKVDKEAGKGLSEASFTNTEKTKLASAAPLASPAFTGVPTAPTAAVDTNNTQIANTAFVQQEINGLESRLGGYRKSFDTVSAMLSDTTLSDGYKVITYRYNTDIVCEWDIVSVAPLDNFWLQLSSGLYAALVEVDYDIRRFGGVDDFNGTTGTNNKTAIDYLISRKPITIKMPKTDTGVYLYDGALSPSNTDLSGVNLEIDEGVSVHSLGLENGPFWRKGVKVNRELKSKVAGADYNLYSSPNQYLKPSEQFSRMTASDGFINKVELIDFSSADVRSYELSSWPTGTLNVITPSSAAVTDINLGSFPASSFKMAGVPVAVGDFIQANLKDGTPRPCVFVQTDGGYVIVQQPPSIARIQVVFSNGTSFDYDDIMFNQLEYRFEKAALGILIHDSRSFSVCVNGIAVKRIDTSAVGGIQLAGWGAGFESGTAGTIEINRPSAFYNKKTIGVKPLKIVCVGDSTSAETLPPSQMQYLKQYLSGSCGAQVWDIKNLAVGGQTSAEQLAALTAADISNYDYCCIQIGVNDIQGAIAPLTLLANINAMIDICLAEQVIPIIGLPIQFYRQVDAQIYGQDGQNTGNSASAPRYRNVVLHGLAVRTGVLVNHSVIEDQGAVLAQLLSRTDLDPVMQDNIHPSAYGQMAMGMSYAKCIIGHMTGGQLDKRGVLIPKYWFNSGIANTVQPTFYTSNGLFNIGFFFSKDGVSILDGATIATIPKRFRPQKTVTVPCWSFTSDSSVPTATPAGFLQFSDTGTVKAFSINSGAVFVSVEASWVVG